MADLAQLESALVKADAAGDIEGARLLAAEVRKMRGSTAPGMFVPSGEKGLPVDELVAGNPVTRFALGAASPFLGASQLLGISPDMKNLEQTKRRGMALAGDETDVAGFAGTMFSPAFLAAAKAIPGATSYIGKILQGMGVGGAAGLTTPVTDGDNFAEQKAIQTGTGAAGGALLSAVAPAVVKAGKIGYKAAIEPWLDPAAIKGRAFLEAAGDKADDIIALLRGNKQIVPGSMPTAGEAAVPAGSAEFSALQRSASNVRPTDYLARADEQNAARIASIQTVGKDKAALTAAEEARSAAATPLYKAAREGTTPVDTAPILSRIDNILAKNPGNRELVNELTNVKRGLSEAGQDPQKVSSVLDGLKTTLANKDNAFIKGTLTYIKNNLSASISGYERAQQVFAKKSEPINQMEIGQYLEKKLVPALSEDAKQKAAAYAGAVQDAAGTIKRSTGTPRFDELSKALTPDQMQVVNSIRDDLARGARFESMAVKGAKAAPDAIRLASGSMENEAGGKIPNLLHRGAMVANAIITRLEGKVNKKLASEMAAEMLLPTKVADTMQQAQQQAVRNKSLAAAIERAVLSTTGGLIQEAEKNK